MNTEERIKKQKELIEEIGRFYDSEGLQPITGRVFAMLMILDKEQFTFEEIAEELQISKASTSNALRNLETREVIEYITVPGDRKKYFRLKWKDEFTLIDDFKRKLRCVKDLHKKILDLKADKNSRNSKIFHSVINMISFFINNIEKLEEEYKKQ